MKAWIVSPAPKASGAPVEGSPVAPTDPAPMRSTDDPAEIEAAYLRGDYLWIELVEQTDAAERMMRDVFRLHPVTLEDLWNDVHLSKVETFENYVHIIVHEVTCSEAKKAFAIATDEMDIVLGSTFLISRVRTNDNSATQLSSSDRVCRHLVRGPAWLCHELLDGVVAAYFPLLDRFDEHLVDLEDDIVSRHEGQGKRLLTQIFHLKRTLQTLRRQGLRQRDVLFRLSRGEFPQIDSATLPFFRDVYEHFARVSDHVDSNRELTTALLEGYFSVQSHRMNEVMKTLTLMSTIMLPLTFIAGVYGMNFKHMPELEWYYGYPLALLLMAVVAVSIFTWFKRKRWL
ncbi:MAG: magnesium/cobalt transporter CorA [Polyangiaceae bacterium]